MRTTRSTFTSRTAPARGSCRSSRSSRSVPAGERMMQMISEPPEAMPTYATSDRRASD
ncbi:hypothetical protein ACWCXX_36840 [Streptomyces sp. NPDC001732]